MAKASIPEAFPAEAQFLVIKANSQVRAIAMQIAQMAGSGYSIHNDDLRQTLLEALAIRATKLSDAIATLTDTKETFDEPERELTDACLDVTGVFPTEVQISQETRRYFGFPETSPITANAQEAT